MRTVLNVAVQDSFWDICGVVATMAATIVALYFGVRGSRLASAANRDREAMHARRVSAWLEHSDPRDSNTPLRLCLLNAGDQPVWDVSVFGGSQEELIKDTDEVLVHVGEPATSTNPNASKERYLGVLPPTGKPIQDPFETLTGTPPPGAQAPFPLRMTFRDSDNRWWERDAHGVLSRHKGPVPPAGPAH